MPRTIPKAESKKVEVTPLKNQPWKEFWPPATEKVVGDDHGKMEGQALHQDGAGFSGPVKALAARR